jgi:hypothetical protein
VTVCYDSSFHSQDGISTNKSPDLGGRFILVDLVRKVRSPCLFHCMNRMEVSSPHASVTSRLLRSALPSSSGLARFTGHRFPAAYLSCAIGSPILHSPSNAASPSSLLTIHARPHARGPLMQVYPKVCNTHQKRAECQRQVPRRRQDARGVFGNATQPLKAHPPSGCRTVRLREGYSRRNWHQ